MTSSTRSPLPLPFSVVGADDSWSIIETESGRTVDGPYDTRAEAEAVAAEANEAEMEAYEAEMKTYEADGSSDVA